MFAVIKTGGKQYRVAPEDVITIEKIQGEVGETISFDEVLMVDSEIGTPLIAGARVAGEVVEQGRAKKIIVFKKKRRQNYRRKKGHRQHLTTVRITEILTGGKAPAKASKPTKADTSGEKAAPADKAASGELTAMFERPAGEPDDLTKINGVGPVIVDKLHKLGITKFSQIAGLSAEDIAKVDAVLNFKGRIERDEWVKQAGELAKDGE